MGFTTTVLVFFKLVLRSVAAEKSEVNHQVQQEWRGKSCLKAPRQKLSEDVCSAFRLD